MMRKVAYMLVGLLLPLNVLAETLTDVIQHTLDTNPDVLITVDNRRAADQEYKQAIGGYLPTLELNAGYGRENTDSPTTRANSASTKGDVTLNRREAGITLSQMLFDGFNVSSNVDRQKFRVDSSAHRVRNTSENVAMRTTEVYLEVLSRQELLELAKDNLVIHQKNFEDVRAKVEGHAAPASDSQQSQSRLALAKSTLVSAQGNIRDAEANYQRVTGELPKVLTKPTRELVEQALPKTLESALDNAMSTHSALRIANADLDAAKAEHSQSNAGFMPRLSLELNANKNNNISGMEGRSDDWSAMLRMRYNLFRGGADQARKQETVERVEAAKEVLRRTQRGVEEDVRLSWNALVTVRERLEHLKQHVDISQQVVNSYKEQFKMGQRGLLDVLNSESELYNARSALVIGQYTELLGMFRVLTSMGILLDTLGVKKPEEARPKS